MGTVGAAFIEYLQGFAAFMRELADPTPTPPPLLPRQREADRLVRKIFAEELRSRALLARYHSIGVGCCVACWSGGESGAIWEAQKQRITMLGVQLKRHALPCHVRFLKAATSGHFDRVDSLAGYVVDDGR